MKFSPRRSDPATNPGTHSAESFHPGGVEHGAALLAARDTETRANRPTPDDAKHERSCLFYALLKGTDDSSLVPKMNTFWVDPGFPAVFNTSSLLRPTLFGRRTRGFTPKMVPCQCSREQKEPHQTQFKSSPAIHERQSSAPCSRRLLQTWSSYLPSPLIQGDL